MSKRGNQKISFWFFCAFLLYEKKKKRKKRKSMCLSQKSHIKAAKRKKGEKKKKKKKMEKVEKEREINPATDALLGVSVPGSDEEACQLPATKVAGLSRTNLRLSSVHMY